MSQNTLSPKEKFKQYLAERRLRKTPERFAILDKALAMSGHFEADLLFEEMEASGYHVSKATIYSALDLLTDCGLLNRHIFGARKMSYEVALGSHFHLVCNACGEIREIEQDYLSQIFDMNLNGFSPTYCSTMVYGLCSECKKSKP